MAGASAPDGVLRKAIADWWPADLMQGVDDGGGPSDGPRCGHWRRAGSESGSTGMGDAEMRPTIRVALETAARMVEGPYDIVYADPPWDYRGRRQFGFAGDVGVDSGGAVKHYATLPLADLCALPVADIVARDALLFLWTTGPQLSDAMRVLECWGFRYATVAFVWDKILTNPGYYTLSQHEFCLVGKRGRIPSPRGARNVRQWLCDRRARHSAKPSEVRDRIAQMFPTQRRVELFARDRVDGWDGWGEEYPSE